MERTRWERIQALFHEAAELPVAERAARVRARCGDDEALALEVLALLEEDARPGSALDRDVARLADDVLGRAPTPPPQAFGPYRIRSVLGEGGMGVVYLAERSDLGSLAAIKLLRDAWLSPARRERFAAEQRTLAQLVHPAIAQLHDAGSLPDGTPWFVMEYVEGVPLTEYCRAHATSIEGRLELLRCVCEAVQHAHGQAIIHRDLKPSNILVKSDGSVKLLDFGIAKHLQGLDATVDQTVTGLRLMTPAYAAPEQLGGGRVGIHTDVYSLGVILYELLAQRPPFDLTGRSPAQAATMLQERLPERPSQVAPGGVRARKAGRASWADLDVLCLTAMHPDPARRYPTVEALMRDVAHYLAGEPLEARPDTLGYRLGKFVRRHRAAVGAAIAATTAILALVGFYTVRLAAARDEARDEAARTARIQSFMLSLFEGGDEAAGPSEDLRVRALLQRGVQEARALEGDPLLQAELQRTLGSLYQKLGDFAQAEVLLTSALERQRAALGDGHVECADTLVLLGLLRVDQARFEEARQAVRSGLELLRQGQPAGHPSIARATAALGQVLEAMGEYEQAIAANEEALRLVAGAGTDSPASVAVLGQLADSHYYAGHYELADELNQRVLVTTQRIYGERHPRVADVLINLGASQGDRGRYQAAEAYYRNALDILRDFYGADSFRSASAETMLGRALVYQKRFDEGVALLESALSTQERVNGPAHPRVASALNDLGSAALQQGRLQEAEQHFRQMLAIYRQVYPQEHYLQGIALSNLASVLTEERQYAAAEELYREALGIYERVLSPTHLNAGIGRIKLGRVLLRQERYAEAEVESLAGYEIVRTQASPSVSWLASARADLVAEYEALQQPERAQVFRAELEPPR